MSLDRSSRFLISNDFAEVTIAKMSLSLIIHSSQKGHVRIEEECSASKRVR